MYPRVSRLAAIGAASVGVIIGVLFAGATPASAAETSKVSVVHGIPGQPVDVYVNGEKTLDNFQPATVAGPLDLPAGSYDIALTAPGGSIEDAILSVDDVAVPGGKNLSVVAHLDVDGNPTLTAFVNDTSRIAAGKARLVVRHTAAAPAVDVRADGEPVFTGLTNPNEDQADVSAGSVSADVVLAGTSTVVIGPADLDLAEGSATIVYAIGSAKEKTLTLVIQKIGNLGKAPKGVPAGSGGLAGSNAGPWSTSLLVVAVLLVAGGIVRLGVIRRRARALSQ